MLDTGAIAKFPSNGFVALEETLQNKRAESVALAQSSQMQMALKANNVRCDLIIIPNGPHATGRWHKVPGVPDWEKQMTEWLNKVLEHRGPVGEGIRHREPAPAITWPGPFISTRKSTRPPPPRKSGTPTET